MWKHPDGSAAKNRSEIKSKVLLPDAPASSTRYASMHMFKRYLSFAVRVVPASSAHHLVLPRPSSAVSSLALRASRSLLTPKQLQSAAAASPPSRTLLTFNQRSLSCTQSSGPLKRFRPNAKPLLTLHRQWSLPGVRSTFAGQSAPDIPIGPVLLLSCFQITSSRASRSTTTAATWRRRSGLEPVMLQFKPTPLIVPSTCTSQLLFAVFFCFIRIVSSLALI
jgi:hypothetical protein